MLLEIKSGFFFTTLYHKMPIITPHPTSNDVSSSPLPAFHMMVKSFLCENHLAMAS